MLPMSPMPPMPPVLPPPTSEVATLLELGTGVSSLGLATLLELATTVFSEELLTLAELVAAVFSAEPALLSVLVATVAVAELLGVEMTASELKGVVSPVVSVEALETAGFSDKDAAAGEESSPQAINPKASVKEIPKVIF